MINVQHDNNKRQVEIILTDDLLAGKIEQQAIQIAIDTIAAAIVEKFKDELIASITVAELVIMCKEKVASKLAERVDFTLVGNH